jgi:short-subunit dehydrogenase
VNLRAPLVLAKAFSDQMAAGGGGHIVFVSSLAGKWPLRAMPLHTATKFGLRGASLVLRQDLAERQIGVSVVLPGFVRDAGMFAVAHRELPRFVRTRSPDDVAHAVVRAVRRNRAEIAVAPLSLRLSAALGGLAPSLACQVNRLLGCRDIASELAAAHRKNR